MRALNQPCPLVFFALLKNSISVLSAGSYPSALTTVNGALFFRATDVVHRTELWTLEKPMASHAPGDANRDFQFDQQDIAQVLQSAKYLTGEAATFEEGDWTGDGIFDQLDIIAALQTGNYLQGPYAVRAAENA